MNAADLARSSNTDTPIPPRWWRKWHWRAAFAIALASTAWVSVAKLFDGQRHLRVDRDKLTISTVTRGRFREFIQLRAHVVPRETVYLDAVEGGRVEQVMVEPGDVVVKDQPIVRLSNTELELVVLDREARLIESITQLQARQSLLEQDRLDNAKQLATIEYNVVRLERSLARYDRAASFEPLKERDNVADELNFNRRLEPLQLESNERQEALRVQQLPQIAAQLTKLHEDVEITRAKLASLVVRAPVAGRMTAIDLTVGENRNRGERLGELTPESGYKLVAAVDEYYLGRVSVRHSATVEIAGRDWPLEVERVYPQVKSGTFLVDLKFVATPSIELSPGQAVQGSVALGAATDALVLPIGPFLQQSGGDWVFVVDDGDDTARRRHIRIGRRNIEQLEVLAGLKPGERVVTSGYAGYDGADLIDIQ